MFTRRYAKRQLTWWRGDPRVHWIDATAYPEPAFQVEQALEILRAHAGLPV